MANKETRIPIPGRLESTAKGGYVAGAIDIFDDRLEKDQQTINEENEDTLDGKVDKVEGKGLSTEDYTTEDKEKLAGIDGGAEVNVQSDWNEISSSSDAFIRNKPESLPASDVYEWAKQPEKPEYSKDEVGLGNVDNTAELDKPVSTATQEALDTKADKSDAVTNVAYDTSTKKLTKTINGNTTDVVGIDTIKDDLDLGKGDVGLGNVDNTSDADKPISSATQAALVTKVS